MGVNKKLNEAPDEEKDEGMAKIKVRIDQGIKLLLILFKKNDIGLIIPTSFGSRGSLDREASIFKERIP